ncbi:MAG: isoleucine--tRNA ligase [Clostridia bacterium]|nr:isoleucine--tRNA ligase [Clostridia bacterium]
MAKDYTNSLNLPKTDFSMRANLPNREPEMLREMQENELYKKMLQRNEGKTPFVLHDGPPFSNGNIHMGTALNKVLKDFIVKYKSMAGYYAPYVPGWDNHGMPIESAIIKKNKIDRKKMSISDFRTACHDFAEKFVHVQMDSFVRLGVLGDWEHPYLTMNPAFEGREVRVFGEMFKKGYIYKGLKPVYWCPHDETALAEAEIEYKDAPCTSIYVKFNVTDDMGKFSDVCELKNTYFIIWTTTTWTLPGNLAIAVHPREKYVLVKAENGENYVVAEALLEKTMKQGGIESWEVLKEFKGGDFEFMKTRHPFLDRESVLVCAEYVTMDSGTGCVHTAPGFGADDYVTCKRYNIDIIVPVDDKGYQTKEAGKYEGLYYEKSNEVILADMKESGALFAAEEIVHQYPHCWRCKNPIIFRATPQWFCCVDAFKDAAAKAAQEVNWMPSWGKDRMVSMIRERADWCISRQRRWGLPIPVFYCKSCGKVICDDSTIDTVAKLFTEKGSNAWFDLDAKDLMPTGYRCECGCHEFEKEIDTLDGWFDSGSTHFSVIEPLEGQWPADLYFEGADQYRGWFQSSLLTAVGAKEQGAPYKNVLTHGWVVDGEGRAMHKSLGNGVDPQDVVKKYGADLLRLWAASSDYKVDVRVSDEIFKQLSEVYRKIRNTARLFMANLNDFNPDTDLVCASELDEIDKWALARLNALVDKVRRSYDNYDFHIATHDIANFCTVDMSKLYIDITKDRLYVEKADSKGRRSAQTAMYYILDSLTRLIAPVLSFTADEIWHSMCHSSKENTVSALLNDMPEKKSEFEYENEDKWNTLFNLRDGIMKSLEEARAAKLIGKSLEAKITVRASREDYVTLNEFRDYLETVFIVSKVILEEADVEAIECSVEAADGVRCDRCWMYTEHPVEDGEGHLCERCAKIVL